MENLIFFKQIKSKNTNYFHLFSSYNGSYTAFNYTERIEYCSSI